MTKGQKDVEENKITVTTYRMPYMTMPKNQLNKIFFCTFAVIILLAASHFQWYVNTVSLFGATCVPLSLYVIPGYYYGKFHKGYNFKKYALGIGFAGFGLAIMTVYTALVIFGHS